MPEPAGAGSTRSPIVARNGFDSACRISTASPVPSGRSTQIVVVSRKRDVEAEVARQRRLDDLLLDLAVERDGDLLAGVVLPDVDQRVLLGELGERDAERPLSSGLRGTTTVSSVGGANWCSAAAVRELADRVADLDLAETPELRDLAGGDGRTLHGGPAVEDADRGHLLLERRGRSAAGRACGRSRRTSGRRRSSRRPGRARS